MITDEQIAELRRLAEAAADKEGAAQYLALHASTILALLAEREELRNAHGSMRNAIKTARYRIEQGRIWNGMGWTLTGLHAHQQQKALDEIDAALQGEQA